jgi:hypothetical protein
MLKKEIGILLLFALAFCQIAIAAEKSITYGEKLCTNFLEYNCHIVTKQTKTKLGKNGQIIKIEITETWEILFPDPKEHDLIQRINRQNTKLELGQKIAIPKQIEGKSYLDFSPFPPSICFYDLNNEICYLAEHSEGYSHSKKTSSWQMPCAQGKTIIFDPRLLAFAAYNEKGELVYWGPAVGGRKFCPDSKKPCQTPQGKFKVVYKAGANYRSKIYPIGCRGKKCAPMPYALFFQDGAAFHASNSLPGKNASHGCIRLFLNDAKWLNQEFAEIGTTIIIRPYED